MSAAAKADVFAVIASPVRRAILIELRHGDKPASELVRKPRMSFAAVSPHLKILRETELASEQRRGRQRIYALNPARLHEVYAWANEFSAFWNDKLDALEVYLNQTPKDENDDSSSL